MSAALTVAIPTHDRRETVLLALRSVRAQTRAAAQIIVLCDGCTDGTQAAIGALGDQRIEVLDLPKERGYGYQHRNHSLDRARGEAIVWMADDDLMLPDHLQRIGRCWDAGGVDLVQTYAAHVDPDDGLMWMGADWSIPGFRDLLEVTNTTPMAAVCVGVRAARAAGGWDTEQARSGDWDLWKRIVRAGGRTASTGTASLLHFRATGRVQAWPQRVRQNAAWVARIEDPAALALLRTTLVALRCEREAWLEREVLDIHASRDSVTHQYDLLLAEYEKLRVAYEALIRA